MVSREGSMVEKTRDKNMDCINNESWEIWILIVPTMHDEKNREMFELKTFL